MTDPLPLLLIHFGAACYMAGVIWFVQLIHYRWLDDVSASKFDDYHQRYTRIMGYVVGPAMCVELVSGALIYLFFAELNMLLIHLSMALLVIIWISTFALQVPCHAKLVKGYDAAVHQKLLKTNWIRTIVWTARVVLLGNSIILLLGTE